MTGEVVAATSSASFKLIFICVAVGWLLKTDRLPLETAPVLTQVNSALALSPCYDSFTHSLSLSLTLSLTHPPTQHVSPNGQARAPTGGPVGLQF